MGRHKFLRRFLAVFAATLVFAEIGLRIVMGNLSIMEMLELHPPDGRCIGLRPGVTVPYTGFLWKIDPVAHDAPVARRHRPDFRQSLERKEGHQDKHIEVAVVIGDDHRRPGLWQQFKPPHVQPDHDEQERPHQRCEEQEP